MIENVMNKIVRFSHLLLLFVLIFGVFLPGKYLIYFLFLLPAIYIHWYFNDNKCMLTELESHFDQKHVNLNNDDEVYHYKYINVLEMLKKINIYFCNVFNYVHLNNYYFFFISPMRCKYFNVFRMLVD